MNKKILSSLVIIASASASASVFASASASQLHPVPVSQSQPNSDEMFYIARSEADNIVAFDNNEQLAQDMIATVELASQLMQSERPTAKMQATVVLNDYINTSQQLFVSERAFSNNNLGRECSLSIDAARINMNGAISSISSYAKAIANAGVISPEVINYHYTNVALQTIMGSAVTALTANQIAMTVGACNEDSLQAMEYLTLINSIANSIYGLTSKPVLNSI